jgi:hypothetical protein
MHKGGKDLSLRAAAGVLAAGLLTLALPAPAAAQGLFESFFGGLSRALSAPIRQPAPIHAFAEPSDRLERVINPPSQYVETGPAKAFCVRTCDGHYFPVRAHSGMSAAEACHAFCPASETRLYSGRAGAYRRRHRSDAAAGRRGGDAQWYGRVHRPQGQDRQFHTG